MHCTDFCDQSCTCFAQLYAPQYTPRYSPWFATWHPQGYTLPRVYNVMSCTVARFQQILQVVLHCVKCTMLCTILGTKFDTMACTVVCTMSCTAVKHWFLVEIVIDGLVENYLEITLMYISSSCRKPSNFLFKIFKFLA